MRKANATYKALLFFTLFFVGLAAFSFAAFRKTKALCGNASKKCSEAPSKSSGGRLILDDFSRRFISAVFVR